MAYKGTGVRRTLELLFHTQKTKPVVLTGENGPITPPQPPTTTSISLVFDLTILSDSTSLGATSSTPEVIITHMLSVRE